MNPIAIFYHVRINGTPRNIDENKASAIMNEQVCWLESSQLLEFAAEFHVNYHGPKNRSDLARSIAGPKANFVHTIDNLDGLDGELSTLGILQSWIPTHLDWFVFYFHTKGVTQPMDDLRSAWRMCMTKATVVRWRECVSALESGKDMAGAHWLTPKQYPMIPHLVPIWGGNFWWAKVSYLSKLPPLPMSESSIGEPGFESMRKHCKETGFNRFYAERWPGMANPKVYDLAPHWPCIEECSKAY